MFPLSAVSRHATGTGRMLAAAAANGENLMEVYQYALGSDPTLRQAEAARMAALQTKPITKSKLLPSVALSANLGHNWIDVAKHRIPAYEGSSNYNSDGFTLSLTQALYHRDYFIELKQADAAVAAADAQYNAAQQALMVRVAKAYFDVLGANDSLEFAKAEKEAVSQQLRQTKQRFDVGLTAITDVHEAQARYDLSVAQEIQASNQLDTTREALREITGRGTDALSSLAEEVPLVKPDPADIEQWVATAQKENLNLLAIQAQVDKAREEIQRRASGRYPSVDLVATHSYADTYDYSTSGSRSSNSVLSLQLNLPLYTGGAVSSQTKQAEYQLTEAQQGLEQQRRASVRQTRDAYQSVVAGISVVKAYKQSLSSTETALQATQAGFEVGTRTAVDVLDSQRELYRARRDYSNSRYNYILATLQLKQAAGILTAQDLSHINALLK